MKKYVLMICLAVFFLSGCEEEEQMFECDASSFKDLVWAQKLISSDGPCKTKSIEAKLYMYDYKGQKVLYYTDGPNSLAMCNERLYNCAGEIVFDFFAGTTKDRDEFIQNRKNEILLWSAR